MRWYRSHARVRHYLVVVVTEVPEVVEMVVDVSRVVACRRDSGKEPPEQGCAALSQLGLVAPAAFRRLAGIVQRTRTSS